MIMMDVDQTTRNFDHHDFRHQISLEDILTNELIHPHIHLKLKIFLRSNYLLNYYNYRHWNVYHLKEVQDVVLLHFEKIQEIDVKAGIDEM
jgi:hypothetical protein